MISDLSPEDAALVLAASAELWPPGPDFRSRAVVLLHRLIPSAVVTFNRLDLDRGTVDFWVSPPELEEAVRARRGRVDRVMEAQPMIEYYLRTGYSRPMRVSDTIPLDEWRDSVLYREHLEPNGLHWTLIHFIPTADRCINSVSFFHAGDDDFTARDVAVLDVLTPMLALGSGGAPRLAGMAGWGMLEIDPDGVVLDVSPPDALEGLASGSRLSASSLRALRGASYGELLVVEIEGHRWRLQVLGRRGEALVTFARPSVVRDVVDKLSARQREVLELVARGLTNRMIADELGIAEGTARKHVEQVLAVLGAANRAAAVAAWQSAAAD